MSQTKRLNDFDRWFQGSKIIHSDHRPRVMYCGTPTMDQIVAFDPNRTGKGSDLLGSGFYFSSDPVDASSYAFKMQADSYAANSDSEVTGMGVMPVFLSIKKPIYVRGDSLETANIDMTANQAAEVIRRAPGVYDLETSPIGNFEDIWSEGMVTDEMIKRVAKYYTGPSFWALEQDFFSSNPTLMRKAMYELFGFDGVFCLKGGVVHCVAWFPNQIKSALGNVGTFSPENPDIRYSLRESARDADGLFAEPRFDSRPVQTDTQEFKRWFGDSKVVDENGQPLVVYHGTKSDFTEFQLGRADRRDGGWFGDGFYLTASQDLASSYAMRERDHSLTDRPANVMPVYVRMSNPYRINLAELSYDEGSNFTKKYGGNEGFRKWLADNGYDGVIGYRDPEIAGQGAGFWEVVVFDPAQIKSATGNVGTFDLANPDIRYSVRPSKHFKDLTDNQNFWRWFGGSKVVDENGRPLVVYHGTNADFTEFQLSPGDFGNGIYTTSDPSEASDYANDLNPVKTKDGANVMPVYVSLQNPYYPTAKDHKLSGDNIKAKAKRLGHDGIIRTWEGSDGIHAIAFRPEQIKSAIGNRGTFDPANPDIRFAIRDEFASDADQVTADLSARLKQLGIADKVALSLRDRIQAAADGTLSEADGRYLSRVIEISLQAQDPARTLNHEVIHALRDLGVIRAAEWRTLERAAKADTEHMNTIRDRYQRLDLSEELIVEEAVAEMYAEWAGGGMRVSGFIRAAFQRIKAFIEALGNALRGNGFRSADSVFSGIERGEVGSRQPGTDMAGSERFAAQQCQTDTAAFKRWFGDSKVTDENGRPLVVYHGTDTEFSVFQPSEKGLLGPGIYLTSERSTAEQYNGAFGDGPVINAYVSLQNPFRFKVNPEAEEVLDFESQAASVLLEIMDEAHAREFLSNADGNGMFGSDFRDLIEQRGHDGIIADWGDGILDIVAFRPTQIKSAIGNRGTFDPANPDIRFAIRDEFARDADAVTADLSARLKQLGIADKVALNLRDRIQAAADSTLSEADGRYLNRTIEVSLAATDRARTLNHEVIHALRDLGVIRAAEWRTLERAARADTERMDVVQRRYAGLGLSEDALVEEAIADMYADWHAGRSEVRGLLRSAFERVRAFLKALGNALRGNGFRTAADVFEDIETGTVGARQGRPARDRGAQPSFARQTESAAFKRWFGDSKVVDENGEPLVVYHGTDADFDAFGEGPSYFAKTNDEAEAYGSNIVPVYVRIENPYTPESSDEILSPDPEFIDDLKAQGYDGIIGEYLSAATEAEETIYIAFEPTQIKSAIGNRGTFDPSNPDIRYSVRQTDTPEFKHWFGDSKAVDFVNADTGAPIVSSKEPARAVPKIMYHTTLADFEAFEVGRSTVNSGTFGSWETERHAIFVTPDVNSSQAYGTRGGVFADGTNVMPLYIKAENPLDLTEGVSEEAFSKLEQAGMSPRYILNTLGHWEMFDDDGGRDVVEMIKAAGYDSVIFNDENPDTGESFESWAVFRPEQIKSATGNRGNFDPANPDIRFAIRDEFASDADQVTADLAARLKHLGMSDKIALNLRDRIQAVAGGKVREADGRYLSRVIEISLQAQDPARTLNHEVIHALRDLGVIRAAEWRALEHAAKNDAAHMELVLSRYASMDLDQNALIEEVVAEMFASWATGRSEGRGVLRTAFERIRDFLQGLGRTLKGRGFHTVESVFRAFERGDVGRRQASDSEGLFAEARFDSRPDQTDTKAFGDWFGDSKIVDSLGKPRVVYHGTGVSIEEFVPGRAGAIFFSERPEFAANFANGNGANVMPVYLKVNNLFDFIDNKNHREIAIRAFNDAGGWEEAYEGDLESSGRRTFDYDPELDMDWEIFDEPNVGLMQRIREMGYDGIRFLEESDAPAIAVFDSNQIKSAIGYKDAFVPTAPSKNCIGIKRITPALNLPSDSLSDSKKSELAPVPENARNMAGNLEQAIEPASAPGSINDPSPF